jgi:hypothetical protein
VCPAWVRALLGVLCKALERSQEGCICACYRGEDTGRIFLSFLSHTRSGKWPMHPLPLARLPHASAASGAQPTTVALQKMDYNFVGGCRSVGRSMKEV